MGLENANALHAVGTLEETESVAARIRKLSPEQKALLAKALLRKQNASKAAEGIRRAPSGPKPLSHSQELMWLAHEFSSDKSTFSVPTCFRLKGQLNVGALVQTLTSIVERHEVFRTAFEMRNGDLVQVVCPLRPFDLPLIEVSGTDAAEAEAEVHRQCVQQAKTPLDLASGSMLRAALYKIAGGDHILFLVTHHIVFDGWSRRVLYRDLEMLYAAHLAGKPSPLPPQRIQYADFAAWERSSLDGEKFAGLVDYWKKSLEGAPTFLDLPTDRPRPAKQSYRGVRVYGALRKDLVRGLRTLNAGEGATLFMTLLAAFGVLLSRYTGHDDILIGTPVLGRLQPEVEHLIGYFSNTLVQRINLQGDPSFRTLLERVRANVLAGFEHQEMPLDRLIQEMAPERNPSHSPLFQVLFSSGEEHRPDLHLPGLEAEVIRVERNISKVDITFSINSDDVASNYTCEYNTDLFTSETIQRFLECFEVLVESIVANPDLPVSALEIVPASQRQLLAEWNRTEVPVPDATVHGLFEAQAARSPDAIAAESEGETLTYEELNKRAESLAHFLRSLGIRPGSYVGVCLDRSLRLPVALLAVMKAGAACVPMDPNYPAARLRLMVEEAAVPVILTVSKIAKNLGKAAQLAVCLDHLDCLLDPADTSALEVPSSATAYVIFTSGSTGRPKGVLLSHANLVNHHLAAISLYGLQPGDRVLQAASISFDISVEEMFPSWIAGATVMFRSEHQEMGGTRFTEWLRDRRITVLDLPTAFWHEWVSDLISQGTPAPDSVRLVIVGGEKAVAGKLAEWRHLHGDRVRWINTYGPTETTVIVTAYEPPSGPIPADLPIGRPIANTRVYVLDGNRRLLPVGVPGELHVAGAGLASFLGSPDAAAAKFVADPFHPGGRLYRTGDVVRFLSDGNLEFVGRRDEQVKIRGFRVEPGEIEALLNRHPDVAEAAVVAQVTTSGTKTLVAYLQPSQPGAVTVDAARQYLRDQLPEYMVPSAFVILERLPRTPNGKTDRAALPAPGPVASHAEYTPPTDPVEVLLAGLWASVLGLPHVGVHDDFFDLGGHSLLAARLMARIRESFSREIGLQVLFEAPTVAQMAKRLGRNVGVAESASVLTPIRPEGTRPPLFCVSRPNVNSLGYVFLARELNQDQPVYGLQAHFRDPNLEPFTQIEYERTAVQYIAAMRQTQPQGPYFLTGHCEGAHIAFEMVRQLERAGESIGMLAVLDAWPQENTRNRFLFHGHLYLREARRFLRSSRQTQIANVLRKLRMLTPFRAAVKGPGAPTKHFHRMQERYWPGPDYIAPRCNTPITVFRVSEQQPWRVSDPTLGWEQRTKSGVSVIDVPSTHKMILRKPAVAVVAEKMSTVFDGLAAMGSGRERN